jgi:1-acyl-sn-glycerol-3-phosphate acyltransferase
VILIAYRVIALRLPNRLWLATIVSVQSRAAAKIRSMNRADAMGSLLAFSARLITGAQGHWKGCPPKAEQRIYFANHQSHLDWVLIWAALPHDLRATTRPIAARDYWTSSRFKHWLTREVFNAVYVSRTRAPGAEDQDPLEPLREALRHGDSLVLFPEGTRSAKGLPQAFKSGLYLLAAQFPQVQLIPAWIDNVQRVMPKGEVVPVPILCTVTFGAPITLAAGEDKRTFLDRARNAVIALRPAASAEATVA